MPPTCFPLRRRMLLGMLAAPFVPPAAVAASAVPRIAELVDATFRPLMAAHDIPGLAVGVVARGQRHLFHYGLAAREGARPVGPDTLFEIGSLSKAFTATLLGYAQALGRLSLDDTPGRHVPALRGSAIDRSTLLQLATYSAAGLPLQFPDEVAGDTAAIAYLRGFTPTAAPGTQRRYSNPSIGLAGHAAAAALGRDFEAVCEAELYPRLGLQRTFLRVPAAHAANYAWGYDKTNRPLRVNPGAFDAEAYGVKTTAADLLRFVEAQLAPASLEPALRAAVVQTQVGRYRAGGLVQGLGWEQYPWPVALDVLVAGNSATMALEPHPVQPLPPSPPQGATLFNKTGSTNGFGAYAAFVPARQVGVVMLGNRNIPNTARVTAAHAVLAALA